MTLLSAVWDFEVTDVKDNGENDEELIRVKRTETVSRGILRDLSHILVS